MKNHGEENQKGCFFPVYDVSLVVLGANHQDRFPGRHGQEVRHQGQAVEQESYSYYKCIFCVIIKGVGNFRGSEEGFCAVESFLDGQGSLLAQYCTRKFGANPIWRREHRYRCQQGRSVDAS